MEVGIERAFYAMKWATHIEDKKANRSTSSDAGLGTAPEVGTVSTEATPVSVSRPRPTFRDSDVQQPPDVSLTAEKKLESLKSKIMKLFARHKTHDLT